jgi:hypothetical protein
MAQDREEDRALPGSHTPGPWFLEPNLEPMGGCLSRAVMAQDTFVAYALFDDEDDDAAEANARLIAAAPELLEAARAGLLSLEANIEAREADHANYSFDTAKDATLVLWRERAAAIRAAIAKARGQ